MTLFPPSPSKHDPRLFSFFLAHSCLIIHHFMPPVSLFILDIPLPIQADKDAAARAPVKAPDAFRHGLIRGVPRKDSVDSA